MKFKLRKLTASDIVPMSKIISKIGLSNFTKAFAGKKGKDEEEVGIQVVLEIVEIALAHLEDCNKEIFAFLSSISGLNLKEVRELSLADFTELVVAVVQKEEFKDFISVVSKFLK